MTLGRPIFVCWPGVSGRPVLACAICLLEATQLREALWRLGHWPWYLNTPPSHPKNDTHTRFLEKCNPARWKQSFKACQYSLHLRQSGKPDKTKPDSLPPGKVSKTDSNQ